MSYRLFNRSSSSESNDDDEKRRQQFEEVDAMIDNYMVTEFANFVMPTPERPPRRRRRVVDENGDVVIRVRRGHEEGHQRLYNDYFAEHPVYNSRIFRRRFRMQKHLFLRIKNAVEENDTWFELRRDAKGELGLSPLQKCTAALRMLAYGMAADQVDEYLRMGETTARTSLIRFSEGVIKIFGEEYLRRPTESDLQRLLQNGERRGFPGMIGSIDCMHWEWKNCPAAWKAQYQGRSGKATLALEAVASQDLWIWHAFFGIPGSCNDLNILHRSDVFDDVMQGRAPPVNFTVNGHQYNMGYYLTDGIYPQWAAFIQGITLPQTDKHRLFAQHQAAARKDVERAFGVLQSRFAIVRHPSLVWDEDAMHIIMKACIIMHNMIVEDERHNYLNYTDPSEFIADRPQQRASTSATSEEDEPFVYNVERPFDMELYFTKREAVRDKHVHLALKSDLIENIWKCYGRRGC